jgi:transposase
MLRSNLPPEVSMATERLSMRKAKEILRLKWVLQQKHRAIAKALGISAGAVGGIVSRAKASGLSWEIVESLSEEELEPRLYGARTTGGNARPLPDPAYIHAERHKPGVTLELLYLEYLQQHPDGYRYTQFCEHYRQWLERKRLSMRQVHQAGEKLFVDYSGKRPKVVDPHTGEAKEVELFVAVMGASNLTYAEASWTQRGPEFIASHARAFEYLGGVPRALVPDQLKSGVTQACRYEPGIQRTYEEMASHYGTSVLPARPRHPRDKAKVEGAVLLVQRWILARLRHETFFSLNALNERILELLEELNQRTMRLYGQSRRELFERLDRPALRPLPVEPFTYAEWKTVRVNIDYHVEVDHHFYSVPYTLVREQLEARLTATTVELYRKGIRVASHLRSAHRGRHTTIAEHMPKAHQKHLEWTPSRLLHWAESIGLQTKLLVERILAERPHPEMGYRTCLGILRLSKRYGNERLERACERALRVRALSYRSVDSILKNGLDRLPAVEPETTAGTMTDGHENVRGGDYYH